ncbi:MAG TPA: Rrf2 family transcriptional regulator [Lichenihabitans sp.]|jgi:Rrf2 family protein|nr:Rrf2 family transcriptional regulator [Lichenihabitans sp.]
MLTNKGKYGLKALVHLAALPPGQTAQSIEIAVANAIPKKFLDAILGELRVAGMIVTRKGKNGGYMLSRPPDEIMAGAAIRALDGPLAPIACASRTGYRPCSDCNDVRACSIRLLMTEVRDLSAKLLDGTSIEDMRRRVTGPRHELVYDI